MKAVAVRRVNKLGWREVIAGLVIAGAVGGAGEAYSQYNMAGNAAIGTSTATNNAKGTNTTDLSDAGSTIISVKNGEAIRLGNGTAVRVLTLTGNGTGLSELGALTGGNGTGTGGSLVVNLDDAKNTLTLSGVNTYTGTTTITQGTLTVTGTLVAGTTISTTASSTIHLNQTVDQTLSGAISGAGNLIKSDTGTLTLSGNSTYQGGTTLSAGGITIGHANALGTGMLTVTGNATLAKTVTQAYTVANAININGSNKLTVNVANVSGTNALTLSGQITGTGTLEKIGATQLTLSGENTYTGGTTISAGTLSVTSETNVGDGTITLQNGATFTVTGAATFNQGITLGVGGGTINNANDVSSNGIISGEGGLTKTGTGTLTLSGTNTYAGGTTVTAGMLSVTDEMNVGSGTFTLNGGKLNVTGGTFNKDIALGANSGTINNENAVSSSGAITGSKTLTKTGAGTLTLSGTNNTATFGTTVSAGTLSVTDETNVGSGTFTLNGSTLNVTGATFNRVIALGAGGGTINNANDVSVSGAITGSNNTLTKTGDGMLTLSGNSSYSGGTTLKAGGITIGHSNALGNAASALTVTGNATLAKTAAPAYTVANAININENNLNVSVTGTSALTLSGQITGTGTLEKTGATQLTLSGTNSGADFATTVNAGTLSVTNETNVGSGAFTLNGGTLNVTGATFNRAIALGASGGTINNGVIVSSNGIISGEGGLTKTGTGTLTLSGENTYSGATIVNAGTLTLSGTNNTATFGTTVNAGTLSVTDEKNVGSGEFTLNGGTLNVTGATFNKAIALGTSGGTINNADAVSSNGIISGEGGLTKTGVGTLTLLGTNTYSGDTKVSGGTLSVTNDKNVGTGMITLQGGATFSVTGAATFDQGITLGVGGGTINHANDVSSNGTISGSGGLTKTGEGTLTLSGTNNTATFATTVSAGTLSVTDATSVGTGTFTLNGSTLNVIGGTFNRAIALGAGGGTINNTAAVSSSGIISGSGSLTKTGAGTLILTGSNTYAGETIITAGTLQIGNGGTAGVIAGNNVVNNATIAFNRSNATTFSGNISGSGDFVKNGGSVALILTGLNTYAGTTSINVGSLSVASDANVGKGAVIMEGGTTLTITGAAGSTFNRNITLTSGTGTISTVNNASSSGIISGDGGLTTTGAGTLTLSGANTYTGATTVAVTAVLALTDTGSIADSSGVNLAASNAKFDISATTSGATIKALNSTTVTTSVVLGTRNLTVGDANNSSHAGTITGTGGLTKIGAGTLILAGANTYSGGTTINSGTLQIGNGGNAGSIAGDVTNDAALVFNRSNTVTFAGVISGSGSLVKTGAGTLTLSGTNTYSGGTTINSGTLQIGNGGNAGSIAGNVAVDAAGTLNFNRSDDVIFGGAVSGGGSLVKTGAGTLTLTGDSSAFAGTFAHNVGGLTLNGANIGGTYTQASGATLTAIGTATLGTATFAGGSIINLDTALGTNKITSTGAVDFSGATTINVNSNTNGMYTLISGTSITNATNASVVNAADLTDKRQGRLDTSTAISYKIFDTTPTTLTWTGAANGNWDIATTNWKDDAAYNTTFASGDSVTFDSTGVNKSITVATSGVSVGTMTVSGGYSFGGGAITASGAVNVTGGSLGLDITTTAPMIIANSVNFNGNALNITGYTPGTTLLEPSDTVIATTGGVTGFNSAVTVVGQASDDTDFLSASAVLANENKNVVVETRLTWDSTDPTRKAHGDFTILDDSSSFTLGAALADNTDFTNWKSGWDGKSLTKLGAGTLILTGANSYTGGTTISAGTLEIGSGGSLAVTAETIQLNAPIVMNGGSFSVMDTGKLTVTARASDLISLVAGDPATSFHFTTSDNDLSIGESNIVVHTSINQQLYTVDYAANTGYLAIAKKAGDTPIHYVSPSVGAAFNSYSQASGAPRNEIFDAVHNTSLGEHNDAERIEMSYNAASGVGAAQQGAAALSGFYNVMDNVFAGNFAEGGGGVYRGQVCDPCALAGVRSRLERAVWVMPIYGHQAVAGLHSGGVNFGYTSDQYAAVFGTEVKSGKTRFGIAGNVGLGRAVSPGAAVHTNSDLTFGGVSLYATQKFGRVESNAQVGWIGTRNEMRQNNAGVRVNADIDGGVIYAAVGFERPYHVGHLTIAPIFGLEFTHLYQNGFVTRGGAGNALFTAGSGNANMLHLPLGVKLHSEYKTRFGEWSPMVKSRVLPHVGDHELAFTNLSAGSTTAATLRGIVSDAVAGDVTFGSTLKRGHTEFGGAYTVLFSEHFTNQNVSVMVKRKF